jgi:DNA-binding transcriptional regulator YiaG
LWLKRLESSLEKIVDRVRYQIKVKARHVGLLTPEQIRALRHRMGLTQREN